MATHQQGGQLNNRLNPVVELAIVASISRAVFPQAKKLPVVNGVLNPGSREGNPRLLAMFKEGFAALSWKDGVEFLVKERVADARSTNRVSEQA
jgi:hypothetical protein